MARVFFTFNPMSVLLAIGAVVIGIPAALIMLTSWLHMDSSEDAFVEEVESQIGTLNKPREVVKNGQDLCDSFEFEKDGMSEFDDESRAYDIRVKDFGSTHGRERELTDKEARVIVKAAKKHLCDTSD